MGIEDVLGVAARFPKECALFSDFDGTLSHIIDDPTLVQPIDGATEVLLELTTQLGTVGVVSGRPVSFLERFFQAPIELSGLYGLEHRTGDQVTVDPDAIEWLPVMSQAADEARERFGTEAVEDKRYSITIHYRRASEEVGEAVVEWADAVARKTGLHAQSAKMSVELHPPTSRTKGDAIAGMLGGMKAAIYLGDDVGDLPAFERLRAASDSGQLEAYATVLVSSDETAPEMHDAATDVVGTAEEAVDVLKQFAATSTNFL